MYEYNIIMFTMIVSVWVDLEGYAMSPKLEIANPGNLSTLRIKTWPTQQKNGLSLPPGSFRLQNLSNS